MGYCDLLGMSGAHDGRDVFVVFPEIKGVVENKDFLVTLDPRVTGTVNYKKVRLRVIDRAGMNLAAVFCFDYFPHFSLRISRLSS